MTSRELLVELEARGVKLSADGDTLRYRAPAAALSPDLRQAMVAHKQALLRLLRPQPDILATDRTTWPLELAAVHQELAAELAERHGLTPEEAAWMAQVNLVMGWAEPPPITVHQQSDGTWPEVELPGRITWRES